MLLSAKALHLHHRAMLDRVGFTNSLKTTDVEVYRAFLELFKRHHSYPRKLDFVVDVKVVPNRLLPTCYELNLVKSKNGQEWVENISYRACCTPSSGGPKDAIKRAMRNAIVGQLMDFRRSNVHVCALCRGRQSIEVDHHTPTFAELYRAFIDGRDDVPVEFSKGENYLVGFRDTDEAFASAWRAYHAEHATLRLLCRTCNLSTRR